MEDLLSVKTAAIKLGFTEQTIRRFMRSKKIPFHKLGRLIRFRPSELDVWVTNNGKLIETAVKKEKAEESGK